jgi:hypothetical protein
MEIDGVPVGIVHEEVAVQKGLAIPNRREKSKGRTLKVRPNPGIVLLPILSSDFIPGFSLGHDVRHPGSRPFGWDIFFSSRLEKNSTIFPSGTRGT